MTGPFGATTVLNYPDCGCTSPTPGTRSATCVVNATLPAADACASACLASDECTAYTWHANAPDNGVWALVCVFRTDSAWQPEYGAADHTAGQKVTPAPPLVWPIDDGYDALPTMWFGANASPSVARGRSSFAAALTLAVGLAGAKADLRAAAEGLVGAGPS